MMKFYCSFAFYFSLLTLSLSQNCTADFTFDPMDLTVTFTDQSVSNDGSPIISWFWDFDDGNTSSVQNPIHTYTSAEDYNVCLTITTGNGCSNSICYEVEICELVISATVGTSCNANNNVQVDVTITDPYDAAREINVLLDGTPIPGSPFDIDDVNPVILTLSVPGDGLTHTIDAQSTRVGTCAASFSFTTTDCTSGCFLSGISTQYVGSVTHIVEVRDNFFSPSSTTLNAADIVEFQWIDGGHTSTSDATSGPDSWNSGELGAGATYSVTINNPGTHPYYCIPHGGPGGAGMSGTIIANCPAGNNFTINVTFNTTVANPAGFNLIIDGVVDPGSPYPYQGTGQNSVTTTIAGDGMAHTITIEDVNTPSCSISTVFNAPNCGAAPNCSISLSATEVGPCDASNQVPVDITVTSVNGGTAGFNLFIDGNLVSGSPFPYGGGSTVINVNVAGDGQSHTILAEDVITTTCSGSTNITTTNCSVQCALTNLNLSTGNPITHTVEVQDFQFAPANISISVNDNVNFIWTGAVPHSTTSDATSGPDSWDSGVIGAGSSFQVTINSVGVHPYYCTPHGGPGGVGMAGSITANATCNNGNVAVAVSFNEVGGSFNGFNVLVDGTVTPGSPYSYDPSGANTVSVDVPGDGQSHSIELRDFDDPACTISGNIATPNCNAPTCQLSASATQNGGCNGNNVSYDLEVSDTGGGAGGFNVLIDGTITPGSPYPYSGTGTTTVSINITGDGQSHNIDVQDVDQSACNTSLSVTTPDCSVQCALTNLNLSTGNPITHTVEVQDFQFAPASISVSVNDNVNFIWTGAVPHSTTSDATSGPDSWDSGVIGAGSSFQVTINSVGVHPYYCTPHGGPGGVGMAGSITANAACNNGNVAVAVSFNEVGGSFNGFNVLVDGTVTPGSPYSYDPSGANTVSVDVPGDGQSHSIELRDFDDPACTISGNITTPNCNAPTCQISATATQNGGCNGNNVSYDLEVSDTGGGIGGFNVLIDGTITPGSPYPYSGTGTTTVSINITGDGQNHNIDVQDVDQSACNTSLSVTTPNCSVQCALTNLNLSTGNPITHTVEVQDFQFFPHEIMIGLGDTVRFIWTGVVEHTTTSDATTGPDSWDSGLLGQGAEYTVVFNTLGDHSYYCIPHGAPGGIGMAGLVTVLPACDMGGVSVNVSFQSEGGSFDGFNVYIDGGIESGSPYTYDLSGQNILNVSIPGDSLYHTIHIQDVVDLSCEILDSIQSPNCNCQLNLSLAQSGGCNNGDSVTINILLESDNVGNNGFNLTVDNLLVADSIPYDSTGSTLYMLALPGDGQAHIFEINDVNDSTCIAMDTITVSNCTDPCMLQDLQITISGGTPTTHIVEVQDFQFSPKNININLGDLVRFDWTGAIPHTSTSDAASGPDSWDSGLLQQGASFDVNIQQAGHHPYYCIPHGAPGGIGMAGSITAAPVCDNGMVNTTLSFTSINGGTSGYNVLIDGTIYAGSPFSYAPNGQNTLDLQLPGDGISHRITIQDIDDSACQIEQRIQTPDCGNTPSCSMQLEAQRISDCIPGSSDVEIQLTIIASNNGNSGYELYIDGNLHAGSPFAYDPSGTTVQNILIAGTGASRSIEVRDVDNPDCTALTNVNTPQCGTLCEVQNLQIHTHQPITHIVEVQDFDFVPSQLDVMVGDSVRFIWTGVIPHTSTSDAASGPDSWDSGLLAQGDTYIVVINTEGSHPYYCIPHGGPGGIGMAGVIEALPHCDEDRSNVNITFDIISGSALGYNVFVDGNLVNGSPFEYKNRSGYNSQVINVAGDTSTHTLTIQDLDINFCAASINYISPECLPTCQIIGLQAATGSDIVHEIEVRDFDFFPATLNAAIGETIRFVWTGSIPHTTTSDALNGPDSWDSGLLGQGATFDVVLQQAGQHQYYCIPHGGPNGIGMAGIINASSDCENDMVNVSLNFHVSNGSTNGYNVFVDGNLVNGSPFMYDDPRGNNETIIQIPGDGAIHIITVQDLETLFCAASVQIQTPDCTPEPCSISNPQIAFSSPINHFVEVRDFDFAPSNIDITIGDTVTFIWTGAVPHTSTSDAASGPDSWDSGLLAQGATFSIVPSQTGNHPYYCIPHGAPGGIGMAGTIQVNPPCNNGNVSGLLTFNSGAGNADQFNILLDGNLYPQSPFDYHPSGNNQVLINLPGDGLQHQFSIIDLIDPDCSQIFSANIPDCSPPCQLQLTAIPGDCNADNNIPIQLTITAANSTSNGFNILLDGNLHPGSPYPYSNSGTTDILILLEGDGLSHDISAVDLDDSNCTDLVNVQLIDCTPEPCSISNPQIAFSSPINHFVEVRDFDFTPSNIDITIGDTVTFIWTGAVPHTSTSDAASGPDSWDSGLLAQGATFSIVPSQTGNHPYYCIPHGAPGGIGMAGTIQVNPPCNNGNVSGLLTFNSGAGNADQFNILLDGNLYPQSPFDYHPSGNNQVLINLPGDGLQHQFSIVDLIDPDCSQTFSANIPDCSPPCELQLDAITGDCNADNNIPIQLTITAANSTSNEFNILLDGNLHPGSPYPYSNSGTTDILILLEGDGLSHDISAVDLDDSNCTDLVNVQLIDCTPEPCSISNSQIAFSSPINHFVEVRDFDFTPSNIDITIGDTVTFIWTGAVPHTSTSDAASGPDSWDSGLLAQGATFSIVPSQTGNHPYYCIPHGGPGGIGMAGTIQVNPPCNNGNVSGLLTFNSGAGNADQFNILLDGNLYPQSPFDYHPSGNNQVLINLPGDGLQHQFSIVDLIDPDCSQTFSANIPDCTPPCQLQLDAITGDCNADNNIPIQLTITAANSTSNGFNILLDGNLHPGSPYPYSNSGTTDILILLEGDGLSHDISAVDLDDSNCTDLVNVQLIDCTPEPCSISNSQIAFSSPINHFVEVRDFDFTPSNIDITIGDTVTFIWTGAVPHTSTSDAASGPDSWDSGLLAQGATFSIVPSQTGNHPYYCIPHGAPGGIGMAGTIQVNPPCNNGNVSGLLTFNSGAGNADQFNILLDGNLYPQSPFDYHPSGNNQVLINLPGDGLQHQFSIIDLIDPDCSQTFSANIPDCSPPCELQLVNIQNSECNSVDSVEVTLWIIAENQGSTFDLLVDNNIYQNNLSYNSGDTTVYSILLAGDGLLHEITIRDSEYLDCLATTSIILPDCTESCVIDITNIQLINSALHIVEVLDFEYSPKDITVNEGDTVRFIWIGAIPHTVTSDVTAGPDAFNSGLLGQGAVFDLVFEEPGTHPYYCIPHGSPGGIGMAGTITVVNQCDDEKLGVQVLFTAANGSQTGYNVLIDNILETGSPFIYEAGGVNQITIQVPANGMNHTIQIEDAVNASCSADTSILMPDCSNPCFGLQSSFAYTLTNEMLQISFTDLSDGNFDSWGWTFGDGNTSSEQNPIHTYSSSGEYEVCLIVKNTSLNCTDTFCTNIVIEEYICSASFSYEIEGLVVHFSNTSVTSQGLNGIMWDFGDNFGASNLQDVSHEYDSLGQYVVCLTVLADSCQSTFCDTINLSNPCLLFTPDFAFAVDQDELCIQLTDLTTTSPDQWLWGFGDGNTSNEQNPRHCYDGPGNYNICLLVQDTVLDCNESICKKINIETTATKNIFLSNQKLVIHPNPSSLLQQRWIVRGIQPNDYNQLLALKMYGMAGKTIAKDKVIGAEQIELKVDRMLSAGVYVIELRAERVIYRGKLIVQ